MTQVTRDKDADTKRRRGLRWLQKPIVLENLSRMEARVLIAKDVLAAMDVGTISGHGGGYAYRDFLVPAPQAKQALDHMPRPGEHCRVCAAGAALVAYVSRFNRLTLEQNNNVSGAGEVGRLIGFFSQAEMVKMEALYEGFTTWPFGERPDKPARMRAIFQHIVDNKGGFAL